MNKLEIIENKFKGNKSDIMKDLKGTFYSFKKYTNIIEHEPKKGAEGKEYFEKLAKVYNYIGYEQKRIILEKIKTIFDLNKLKFSLNRIENIEFNILISSWVDKNDKSKYKKLEKHYEKLIDKNNKEWMNCMNKHEKAFHKYVNTIFWAPAYRFFLPNYEKISDDLLEEMDVINEASEPIFEERDKVLEEYKNYLIHVEALHKLNSEIDELYSKSFNFLWDKIKGLSLDDLMQINCILEG